jgi:hypothetical protein
MGYFVNSTSGTELLHPNSYTTTAQKNTVPTLNAFNMTMAIGQNGGQWDPILNNAYNFENGVMWSSALPTELSGVPGFGLNNVASGVAILTGGFTFGEGFGGETNGWLVVAGFSLATGNQLWITNFTETPFTRTSQAYGDGLFINFNEDTFVVQAYSEQTGALEWTTTLTGANGGFPNPYDEFNLVGKIGNGVIFFVGFGGDIWDVSLTDGSVLWYTNTTTLVGTSGTETPYGVWPLWVFSTQEITNTELLLAEGHEYDPPLFHGSQELGINATNGQLVWSVLSFDTTGGEISYGILCGLNSYDGQIYAYGQGPSATTVIAANPVAPAGTPVVIRGTVMDVSAGASQEAVKANFPNGLPCVSDASQSTLMPYVYEQQPHPSTVTGVPVVLTSIDPNGNTVPIGTATSDASGMFTYTWMPPIPGNYTIIATFEGSGAYYGSYSETSFYATSAPATPAPTATPVSLATTQSYIMIGVIAIIVVIIIIGAILAMLLLRKRP